MGLKENAALLLSSPNPKVMINFPLRSEYSTTTSSTGSKKKQSTKVVDGWITKKNKTPRSTSKTKKKKATSTKTKAKKGRKNSKGRGQTKKSGQPEVIDISDDSSSSDDETLVRQRSSRLSAKTSSKKIRSCDDSLFDTDQSSENEF